MPTLISAIGPVEHIRRGYVVRATFDPEWDHFVLTATSRHGNGSQKALPSWTELYREDKKLTTKEMLRRGAQLSVKSLDLVLH